MTMSAQYKSLNDKVKYLIGYEMYFRLEDGRPQQIDEMTVLEIGTNISYFYSKKEQRAEEIKDSIEVHGINPHEYLDLLHKYGYSGQRTAIKILKNFPQKGTLTSFENIMHDFRCEEPMPDLNWQFENADSTICGYACKKASVDFRGRRWTAWYAPAIPISDGPWKLCGLPGLILCAYEAKGDFRFLCNEIRNGDGKYIRIRDKKAQNCSLEKIIELKRMSVESTEVFFNTVMGKKVTQYDKSGKRIMDGGRKACLMEVFNK